MPAHSANSKLAALLKETQSLRKSLAEFGSVEQESFSDEAAVKRFVELSGKLLEELRVLRETVSPVEMGQVGITLGRAESIAKFFAFSFIRRQKRKLRELPDAPFYGSGIYAIYYHGGAEASYQPISGTETPIYVGKADPAYAYADTVEEQGQVLYRRLKEHARNIGITELILDDFYFRAATIQSGMQAAVEEFLIRLFHPVWNRQVGICQGLGKHGDSAKTRANKRSPWDTMHPGRAWADKTEENQVPKAEIMKRIAKHFERHPPILDKEALLRILAIGAEPNQG